MPSRSAESGPRGRVDGNSCVRRDASALQPLRPGFGPGDLVEVRGAAWRVREVARHGECHALTLDAADPGTLPARRVLLTPFDRPRGAAKRCGLRSVSAGRWRRRLLDLVAAARRSDGLMALASAKIDFLPYQMEPALALLGGQVSRVLIADAVGLGKTIQAGLVVAELAARGQARHVLVATPAGLRDQWARELDERFGVQSAIVDAPWLRQARQRLPASVNPWSTNPVVVTSLDFVKRPENLGSLAAIVWDLFILDEAHAAGRRTDRAEAAHEIGRRSRRVVLLTATPHSGDIRAFAELCSIGSLDASEPVALYRRPRSVLPGPRRRRVRLLRVRATGDERRMHEVLAGYARRAWESARMDQPDAGRLAITVLLKRGASSAYSLLRSASYRRSLLAGGHVRMPVQISLPIDDEEPEDGEPADGLDAPALSDGEEERMWLDRLIEAAGRAALRESKLLALARLLRRVAEPVIVFTEYRDTLRHVLSALSPAVRCTALHGGLDRDGRGSALREFEAREARVLLATDAGGEGLNLHAHCRLVVNIELPWNPVRLEQRIGRVDRIGQQRTVHAINMVSGGGFEETLVARLAARVEQARAALGPMEDAIGPLDEVTVAGALIRGTPLPPVHAGQGLTDAGRPIPIAFPRLTAEATVETARAETARRLRRPAAAHSRIPPGAPPVGRGAGAIVQPVRHREVGSNAAIVATVSRRRLLRRLHRARACDAETLVLARSLAVVCLFIARLVDTAGRLIEELLIPVAGFGSLDVPRLRAGQRRFAGQLIGRHGGALLSCARDHARRRAKELEAAARSGNRVALDREVALMGAANRWFGAARLRQGGLFDLRAERDAQVRREELAELQQSGAMRLAALEAAEGVSLGGDPEMEVVLLLSR
jgi:superfamily II DNA or RNA helicase